MRKLRKEVLVDDNVSLIISKKRLAIKDSPFNVLPEVILIYIFFLVGKEGQKNLRLVCQYFIDICNSQAVKGKLNEGNENKESYYTWDPTLLFQLRGFRQMAAHGAMNRLLATWRHGEPLRGKDVTLQAANDSVDFLNNHPEHFKALSEDDKAKLINAIIQVKISRMNLLFLANAVLCICICGFGGMSIFFASNFFDLTFSNGEDLDYNHSCNFTIANQTFCEDSPLATTTLAVIDSCKNSLQLSILYGSTVSIPGAFGVGAVAKLMDFLLEKKLAERFPQLIGVKFDPRRSHLYNNLARVFSVLFHRRNDILCGVFLFVAINTLKGMEYNVNPIECCDVDNVIDNNCLYGKTHNLIERNSLSYLLSISMLSYCIHPVVSYVASATTKAYSASQWIYNRYHSWRSAPVDTNNNMPTENTPLVTRSASVNPV